MSTASVSRSSMSCRRPRSSSKAWKSPGCYGTPFEGADRSPGLAAITTFVLRHIVAAILLWLLNPGEEEG
jgi:hypothetical protein